MSVRRDGVLDLDAAPRCPPHASVPEASIANPHGVPMTRYFVALTVCLFPLLAEPARAADLSAVVSLENRSWGEHELGWRLGESVGLRWAIVDGISGRGRLGGEQGTAAVLAEDFEKQTGIRTEIIGGIVVLHRPNEAKRKALEAKLSVGGAEAAEAAWLLGWLKDAHAWPALARAATAKDPAVALAAAQALRRLDGEEHFDIRRWLIPYYTIHRKENSNTAEIDQGLWQAPLGMCVPDAVTAAELETLARSAWLPLREAAARLAPGCAGGKAVAEKLATDPSLLVRQAGERALRAWQAPAGGFKPIQRPMLKVDLKARWNDYRARGDEGARHSGSWLAAFGSDEDVARLVEMARETKDPHIPASTWYALVANAGGKTTIDHFRKCAGEPKSKYLQFGRYGLTVLLDGEALTNELGPLLGTDKMDFSSAFMLARYGGPPAMPYLEVDMEKRGYVDALAIGAIGGPRAVRSLTVHLDSRNVSTAIAAARGLGDTALPSAVGPLVKALAHADRLLRNRAALGLGRLGGPEAANALASLLKTEKDYLVRRAACQMLKEIGTGEKAHADLVAQVEKELTDFVPSYNPINPRFGPDFPTGKWVNIAKVDALNGGTTGETRWGVDAFSGLLVRYGGCEEGGYNNECLGFDPASEKWFVIRPWELLGMFYNETRPAQGCSRGLAFDARSRLFWINHAIGGTGWPANRWYPSRRCCTYDDILDRFAGSFPDNKRKDSDFGEGPSIFVADCRRGRIFTEIMGPVTSVIDTATTRLVDLPFEGAPNMPVHYKRHPTAFDPVSGLVLRYFVPDPRHKQPADQLGLWLFDSANGTCRRAKTPFPEGTSNGGTSMCYDSLNREVLLFLSSGTWRYQRDKEAWDRVANEDGKVYIVDFDVQHNVFLARCGGFAIYAYRFKNVPVGTKAFFGEKGQGN